MVLILDNFEDKFLIEPVGDDSFSVGDADEITYDINERIAKKNNNLASALKKEVLDWLEVVITAVISVVVVFTLFFRVATIDGPSMKETLHHGDKVIITNFAYTPKNGDIVVISRNYNNTLEGVVDSQMPIIKRVIATEGQTVDIDFEKGIVYVDGKALDEPYTSSPTTRQFDVEFPLTVSPDCIFVLGDNRNDSLDSRDSSIGLDGMIDTRYVLGKAVYRIFPLDDFGGL